MRGSLAGHPNALAERRRASLRLGIFGIPDEVRPIAGLLDEPGNPPTCATVARMTRTPMQDMNMPSDGTEELGVVTSTVMGRYATAKLGNVPPVIAVNLDASGSTDIELGDGGRWPTTLVLRGRCGSSISLFDCDGLESLTLPESEAAVEVRLHFRKRPAKPISIIGNVSGITADWPRESDDVVSFLRKRPVSPLCGVPSVDVAEPWMRRRRGALKNAWIGNGRPPEGLDAEYWLIVLPEADTSEVVIPKDASAKEITIAGLSSIESIRIGAGPIGRHIEIHEMPGLVKMRIEGALACLRTTSCPWLTSVEAEADHAIFRREIGGSEGRFTLVGRNRKVGIASSSAVEFEGFQTSRVELVNSRTRCRIATQGRVKTCDAGITRAELEMWLRQRRDPPPSLEARFEAFVEAASKPADVLTALQWLVFRLQRGALPPVRAWSLRNTLYENQAKQRFRGKTWMLPNDLADLGFHADAELWIRCRRNAKIAADVDADVFGKVCLEFAAHLGCRLLELAGSTDADEYRRAFVALMDAPVHKTDRPVRHAKSPKRTQLERGQLLTLRKMVRLAQPLSRSVDWSMVADRIPGWIDRNLEHRGAVEALVIVATVAPSESAGLLLRRLRDTRLSADDRNWAGHGLLKMGRSESVVRKEYPEFVFTLSILQEFDTSRFDAPVKQEEGASFFGALSGSDDESGSSDDSDDDSSFDFDSDDEDDDA